MLLLSLRVYILAVAADQLQTSRRAAFAIAAPMVIVTNQGAAVMTSRISRASFKEIPLTANGDALVDLTANVDFGYGAALAFQHVSAAQFTFRSHVHPSVPSIIPEFLKAAAIVECRFRRSVYLPHNVLSVCYMQGGTVVPAHAQGSDIVNI